MRDLLEIIDHKNIIVFSVTGQGDGTWLIDNDGESNHPALLWLGSRSSNIVNKLRKDPNDIERYNINMTGLNSSQQGPQLIWFKENNKEILQRSVKALHC
ncbi:MAG: FGGY family carbohydrate kinase, partial [Candidatus Poseidoniales archaeon]